MSQGYVYVLSNPAMPGIVKIGYSAHGGQGRADALYKNDTGVPMPFVLEFEVMSHDAPALEKEAHAHFAGRRINERREFFKVDAWEATAEVMRLAAKAVGIHCNSDPLVICLEDAWSISADVINGALTAKGYEPIDKAEFSMHVEFYAYSPELVLESVISGQDARRRYKDAQAAKALKDAGINTWELH